MQVTIIKTGSTSLNVLVIYRRLTELMITPVRGRRDAFINTAGFHRECRCFSRYQKDRRNISPFRRCFLIFFLFFSSSLLFLFFTRRESTASRAWKYFSKYILRRAIFLSFSKYYIISLNIVEVEKVSENYFYRSMNEYSCCSDIQFLQILQITNDGTVNKKKYIPFNTRQISFFISKSIYLNIACSCKVFTW